MPFVVAFGNKGLEADTIQEVMCPYWTVITNANSWSRSRIWVLQDYNQIQVNVLKIYDEFICLHIDLVDTCLYITVFYGVNDIVGRGYYGRSQVQLVLPCMTLGLWVVTFCFNSMLKVDKRIGGDTVLISEVEDFCNFPGDHALPETNFLGPTFTWSDKQGVCKGVLQA